MFVVKNKDLFKTNSDVHSFNTRSRYDLHTPAANLAAFQKECGMLVSKPITIFHQPRILVLIITV